MLLLNIIKNLRKRITDLKMYNQYLTSVKTNTNI